MKNIKLITLLTVLAVILLGGCKAKTYDTSENYVLPEGLSDCKVFYMVGKGTSDNIAVVRCPNSQTASQYSRTYTDSNNMSQTVTYRAAVVEN